MELKTISLGQRPARVWTGGTGEAIVLLHGGWAGAEAYWSTVTDDLECTHLVVAPELPPIHSPEGLPSFGAYAAWLAELLTAMGIERATLVGNSLGATIAWRFAGQYPERSAGLVVVNGYQPPGYSKMLRWLAGETPIRRLARGNLQRLHFGPEVLPLAFHDRSKVPAEILRTLDGFTTADADRVVDVLLSGEEAAPPPKGSVLLIFGEADRSPVLGGPMMAVAIAGLIVNLISMKLLSAGSSDSLNVKGAYFEVMSDMLGSLGVHIAQFLSIVNRAFDGKVEAVGWGHDGAAIRGMLKANGVPHQEAFMVGAGIGLFIIPRTWMLLREAIHILMEGTPPHVDLTLLERTLLALPGVTAVHDIHVWTITSGVDSMSCHLVIADMARSRETLAAAQAAMRDTYDLTHTTIQIEDQALRAEESVSRI